MFTYNIFNDKKLSKQGYRMDKELKAIMIYGTIFAVGLILLAANTTGA